MLLIQGILIFAKIMVYISWSWWLVLTPVWLYVGLFVVGGIVSYFLSK